MRIENTEQLMRVLRDRRKALGLGQLYIGNKLNASRSTISKWESCNREINLCDALAYCKLLKLNIEVTEDVF